MAPKILKNNAEKPLKIIKFPENPYILENPFKKTRKPFKIIITGVFSYLFRRSLGSNIKVDKDITINGLLKATDLINYK